MPCCWCLFVACFAKGSWITCTAQLVCEWIVQHHSTLAIPCLVNGLPGDLCIHDGIQVLRQYLYRCDPHDPS